MFTDFPFSPDLLTSIEKAGFSEPTEIQQRVIPELIAGKDLLVAAKTGSGKTAAYLLPLIEQVYAEQSSQHHLKVLILVPVRELAEQVAQSCQQLCNGLDVNCAALTGGKDFKQQQSLLETADIIIATPGRVLQHLEAETFTLEHLQTLVLDEADRMLAMGFRNKVTEIIEQHQGALQKVILSATLHSDIRKLAKQFCQDEVIVALHSHREQHDNIRQLIMLSDDLEHKDKQLCWLLSNEPFSKAIVFTNSKIQARRLDGLLRYKKFKASQLHGDVQHKGRLANIESFRLGKTNVLVATDIAARGLDVEGVDLVINYDMPRKGDEYIHRIGRTGRAEQQGEAISLIAPGEWNLMSSIERYLKVKFERKYVKELAGSYKGPKKVKASGKAAGSKKKKKVKKRS